MESVVEVGADDFVIEPNNPVVEVVCKSENLMKVKKGLEERGFQCNSELIFIPSVKTALETSDQEELQKMLEAFEGNEDVQQVHHNADIS